MKQPVKHKKAMLIITAILAILISLGTASVLLAQPPTLYWGSSGQDVINLQSRLQQWGYYDGVVDGNFGAGTYNAVLSFQQRNGLPADGVVGPGTWSALGLSGGGGGGDRGATTYRPSRSVSNRDDITLLARLITAEAGNEPYEGQVAVGAVILNRVASAEFPDTLSGVVFQPDAFESITNGLAFSQPPFDSALRAAQDAINGWDPTGGAIFFWNPSKPVSGWIWSRPIVTTIGNHVFAK